MALPIRSPWLHQLKRERPAVALDRDIATDVIVVGGGIAGASTAYFLMRHTTKKVVLLEADKVAHGATGHNAGQLVAEFERSFSSLVRQFGLEQAAQGLRDLQSAWVHLEGIQTDLDLKTPIWRTTGYGGLCDPAQVVDYLNDSLIRAEAGLDVPKILVAEEWQPGMALPAHFEGLYEWVPQSTILSLLETDDKRYIGSYVSRGRGCMNSALFCEELVLALLKRWPKRFSLYESTPVTRITLGKGSASVAAKSRTATAARVVLCTNGFENLALENKHGPDINPRFHHEIEGKIGYMAAFVEPSDHPPLTNWYQDTPGIDPEDPYFYITRRPYDLAGADGKHNLISVGGPETDLPEASRYDRGAPYGADAHREIDTFMRRTYRGYRPARTEDAFFWHGLMGYTANRTRLIGPEPCNPALLYNLGCNGIGLLPSIFGGWTVSQQIKGKKFTPLHPQELPDSNHGRAHAEQDTPDKDDAHDLRSVAGEKSDERNTRHHDSHFRRCPCCCGIPDRKRYDGGEHTVDGALHHIRRADIPIGCADEALDFDFRLLIHDGQPHRIKRNQHGNCSKRKRDE
jgi:glycine/D-amino acid oxidase-like deaminating enzyme